MCAFERREIRGLQATNHLVTISRTLFEAIRHFGIAAMRVNLDAILRVTSDGPWPCVHSGSRPQNALDHGQSHPTSDNWSGTDRMRSLASLAVEVLSRERGILEELWLVGQFVITLVKCMKPSQ